MINKCNETTAAASAWADLVIERTFAIQSNGPFNSRVDQARRRAIRSHGIRR